MWDGILKGRLDSRVRGQVKGVQTQMQSFNFFLEIQLGVLVLRHRDNSSSILQYTHIRGVDTNNRVGARFKLGPFLYSKYKRGTEETNVSSSC